MDILSSSSKRIHESNVELYRSRLAGRLCIAIVCALQIFSRTLTFFFSHLHLFPATLLLISTIFSVIMLLIISAEYIFFKKIGPKMAKYANMVDMALLLLFIGDWSMVLVSTFNQIEHTNPPTFQITAIYGFTSFSWRSLLVTLIIQKWQLKILPALVACIISSVYATIYNPDLAFINLFRVACQLAEIFLTIYCENRIKWRMIWTNLHREKWVQVNNFILNNIPENIMILGFSGKPKFISDHCKVFMEKSGISHQKAQDLFSKIRDLQPFKCEQEYRNSTFAAVQIERLTTQHELLPTDKSEDYTNKLKIEALEDLITNFKQIIEEKGLKERQFLIYNGKLKMEEEDDFKEKSIEIKISFIHHVEKEYIILILRDTTQRDLLVTLEETSKYKDQLLASVSHELRAPLNGTINLVEAAINSPKTPEDLKQTLLTPALRSSKFLLHIINDILDMSQIKQKKLRLDFQSRNLKETLNNAAQLIELQAQKKRIELQFEFDQRLPMNFCTDHLRLNQIILNLLSNAIKFTNEGFIKLKAIPMAPRNWVKITVEDSGIGICHKNLDKVFSIQLDGRQSINLAGVGLGLNIASSLANLLAPKEHPGMSVSSMSGQGSIFSFILENKQIIPAPLPQELGLNNSSSVHEIAEEKPEDIKLPNTQKFNLNSSVSMIDPLITQTNELETLVKRQCSCPKILIVDDNPFNIMAFETILSSLDVKCDSVYSGSACIKRLLCKENKTCGRHCKPYSVIFMDQEMPEMTGSETVAEIRRLQEESQIPHMKIIGCTAHKAKEDVDKFMESGLDSCIFKPISVVMIRDILKEI